MKSPTISPISVDLKTASAKCGYSIKTLRRAIQRGELRAIKATRKIVILVADLQAYLEANAKRVGLASPKRVK